MSGDIQRLARVYNLRRSMQGETTWNQYYDHSDQQVESEAPVNQSLRMAELVSLSTSLMFPFVTNSSAVIINRIKEAKPTAEI